MGYAVGEAVGKRIMAIEQYSRGYYFGDRNANKKTARQNIDKARATGNWRGKRRSKRCIRVT
jgi:hypothetical protein